MIATSNGYDNLVSIDPTYKLEVVVDDFLTDKQIKQANRESKKQEREAKKQAREEEKKRK